MEQTDCLKRPKASCVFQRQINVITTRTKNRVPDFTANVSRAIWCISWVALSYTHKKLLAEVKFSQLDNSKFIHLIKIHICNSLFPSD